jgi:hypothetical protein
MHQIESGTSAADIQGVSWHKSSRSNSQGNCVELAALPTGQVAIRNSRCPEGPALVYPQAEIAALILGVKNGDFDHLVG